METLREKKKVAILGLGQTGLASALTLRRKGYSVFVSDSHSSEALEERSGQLQNEKIPFELGRHTLETITASDWVLISPGIPPTSEVYRTLRRKNIPVVSEIEVASWFSRGKVTAVTGTSGKTTVTTLLAQIYRAHGLKTVLCGNIGNPWIGELDPIDEATRVVVEVSSFQLLHTETFRPHCGVLLNVGQNHLDWHESFEDYVAAKLRLFRHQTSRDFAFLRRQDRQAFFPNFPFQAKIIDFSDRPEKDLNRQLLFSVTEAEGLDPARTEKVLNQFRGLEHRLETLGEVEGVSFVNDSKSTTVESLEWGLNRFPDRKVILLAGGHPKGGDFRGLRQLLQQKGKLAVLFGEARPLLKQSWEGSVPLTEAGNLEEAFQLAVRSARTGDVVLLSPACASFDQFSNYQERGRFFKKLVAELKTGHVPA